MDIEESERQRIETEKKRWGDRTEEWLCDAAMRGDVGSLKEIIANDEYILDKVLVGGFKGKNPLHVAISTGQREFALELLRTKPELAEVLDTELGTALHIASSKGHVEIVEHLVENIPGMCMTRNREGNNPLHIAAMKGKVEVLKVLLRTSPQAAQVRVDQGYTILHLCVNYNQLESLKELLHAFKEDPGFVASTDIHGNNILHLVVFNNRHEMIQHVLSHTEIDVNAKNGSGRTALDFNFLALGGNQPDREIDAILHNAGAKRSQKSSYIFTDFTKLIWKREQRNTLLVVSSLIAAIEFQVGVNPPGGTWVDNSVGVAGKSIYAYNHPLAYWFFMFISMLGLFVSLSTILLQVLLLPEPRPSRRQWRAVITWWVISVTAGSYFYSVFAVSPSKSLDRALGTIFSVWFVLITTLAWHTRVRSEPFPCLIFLISCSMFMYLNTPVFLY